MVHTTTIFLTVSRMPNHVARQTEWQLGSQLSPYVDSMCICCNISMWRHYAYLSFILWFVLLSGNGITSGKFYAFEVVTHCSSNEFLRRGDTICLVCASFHAYLDLVSRRSANNCSSVTVPNSLSKLRAFHAFKLLVAMLMNSLNSLVDFLSSVVISSISLTWVTAMSHLFSYLSCTTFHVTR